MNLQSVFRDLTKNTKLTNHSLTILGDTRFILTGPPPSSSKPPSGPGPSQSSSKFKIRDELKKYDKLKTLK